MLFYTTPRKPNNFLKFLISKLDHHFDYFEERWITLGTRIKDKILVVANMFFDENGEEIIHITVRGELIRRKGFFMSNIKEREKFDDYEMLEEYDFSNGIRGRFYEPKKINLLFLSILSYNILYLYHD